MKHEHKPTTSSLQPGSGVTEGHSPEEGSTLNPTPQVTTATTHQSITPQPHVPVATTTLHTMVGVTTSGATTQTTRTTPVPLATTQPQSVVLTTEPSQINPTTQPLRTSSSRATTPPTTTPHSIQTERQLTTTYGQTTHPPPPPTEYRPTTQHPPPPPTEYRPTTQHPPPPPTEYRPTTQHPPPPPTEYRPTTQHPPPHPTEGRSTEEPHPHPTHRPPPETEQPHPTKPHKPTIPHPVITRSTKPPSHPTTAKDIVVPTEGTTTSENSGTTLTEKPYTPVPYPDAAIQLHLQISWLELCPNMAEVRSSVARFASVVLNLSYPLYVELLNDTEHCPVKRKNKREAGLDEVQVDLCFMSKGTCDALLTENVGLTMQQDLDELQTYLKPKVNNLLVPTTDKITDLKAVQVVKLVRIVCRDFIFKKQKFYLSFQVLSVGVYRPPRPTSHPRATNKPTVGIATGLSLSFLITAVVTSVVVYKVRIHIHIPDCNVERSIQKAHDFKGTIPFWMYGPRVDSNRLVHWKIKMVTVIQQLVKLSRQLMLTKPYCAQIVSALQISSIKAACPAQPLLL